MKGLTGKNTETNFEKSKDMNHEWKEEDSPFKKCRSLRGSNSNEGEFVERVEF